MKNGDWIVLGLLGVGVWLAYKSGVLGEAGGGGGVTRYGDVLGGAVTVMWPTTGQLGLAETAPPYVPPYIPPYVPTYVPPIIPIDYPDLPRLIYGGIVEPPTMVTYGAGLLNQPMELYGKTWKSGTRPQDRPDYTAIREDGLPPRSGASVREGGAAGTGGVR